MDRSLMFVFLFSSFLTFLFLNVFVLIVFVTESTHFHFCVEEADFQERLKTEEGASTMEGTSTFRAEFWRIHGREPSMCEMHEFFHRRPDGTWDSIEAERVQNEMDAFEAAFDISSKVTG
ncbi:hypothetical protein P8452_68837 [Trifolium repens]|nr:hypothetical protein P8452_68837 [Trifolium repens]